MDKVLVTGAAGFIGRNLCEELVRRGYYVVAVDDMSLGTYKNLVGSKAHEIYFSGATDFIEAEKHITNYDYVVHLGANSSTSCSDLDGIIDNNAHETLSLERETRSANRKRFIYASSAACYHSQYFKEPENIEDMHKEKPSNLYGFSKWYTDFQMFKSEVFHEQSVCGLRYFNVYGPYEGHKGNMISWPLRVFKHMHNLKNGPLNVYTGQYTMRRDFIYVKDAVDMTIKLMRSDSESGIYNVGTGRHPSWKTMANYVFGAVGHGLDIHEVDLPDKMIKNGYQYITKADMTKTREAIDVEITDVKEAVSDYVNNYLQKEWYQGYYV
jgi:ADP-L-glycero-D-manno-heptose 6-epimerase